MACAVSSKYLKKHIYQYTLKFKSKDSLIGGEAKSEKSELIKNIKLLIS